jgi:hypothetical protein
MPIDTRSTNDEFGWKLETAPQTKIALTGADFGMQIYDPSIQIAGDPEAASPVAAASRPLFFRKTQNIADVSFKQALTRGVLAATPSWMSLLEAAGFTLAGSVATMGARPDNTKSISCEWFDGIVKCNAWGVRGLIDVVADNTSGKILMGFSGKGHGAEEPHVDWPAGITDDTQPHAIFENNSMTIDGLTPELVKCGFKTEGEPTIVPDALKADGFVEPRLVNTQAFLRPTILMNDLAIKDWYAFARGSANNKFAVSWGIDLGTGKEIVFAGMAGLSKYPAKTRENNLGVFPLEFQFVRGTDITITYQDRA